MHIISGQTVSETIHSLYSDILNYGTYRESRNGGCRSLYDVNLEIKNPRSRHLQLNGRKSNIFAMIAETFWVMAGDSYISPYLDFFLPRAKQYSDDGKTWNGAYGPRLYYKHQLQSIPLMFKEDGLETRRAIVTIHDSDIDSSEAIEETYGAGYKGLDRPCNLLLNFYVIEDNKFVTKVIQRSGDAIFGTGSINPFEFSFLHEMMYNEVKKYHPDLKLGPYRWHVTNAHLYDFSSSQAETALKKKQPNVLDENTTPLFVATGLSESRAFFEDLVELYTEMIQADVCDYHLMDGKISHIYQLFEEYQIPKENNILVDYVGLVYEYIVATKMNSDPEYGVVERNPFKMNARRDSDLYIAVQNSSFRKFDIV